MKRTKKAFLSQGSNTGKRWSDQTLFKPTLLSSIILSIGKNIYMRYSSYFYVIIVNFCMQNRFSNKNTGNGGLWQISQEANMIFWSEDDQVINYEEEESS